MEGSKINSKISSKKYHPIPSSGGRGTDKRPPLLFQGFLRISSTPRRARSAWWWSPRKVNGPRQTPSCPRLPRAGKIAAGSLTTSPDAMVEHRWYINRLLFFLQKQAGLLLLLPSIEGCVEVASAKWYSIVYRRHG